jgi:hypothetical protein
MRASHLHACAPSSVALRLSRSRSRSCEPRRTSPAREGLLAPGLSGNAWECVEMRGNALGMRGNALGMRGNAWAAWLVGAGGWRLMGGGAAGQYRHRHRELVARALLLPVVHGALVVLRIDNSPVVLRVDNNPCGASNVVHRMPPRHFETSESLAAPLALLGRQIDCWRTS